jgi:methylated-DNA-protein-cysteine methyltransferase-like protein
VRGHCDRCVTPLHNDGMATRRDPFADAESARSARGRRRRRTASDPLPPFYRLVYRVVRRVPRGKVVTYGQVAAILGQPRAARAVGMALAALNGALLDTVPWQRVIAATGRCSHRDGFWASVQRDLLEREGVNFDRHGYVDLRKVRWAGPRREWKTGLRTEL